MAKRKFAVTRFGKLVKVVAICWLTIAILGNLALGALNLYKVYYGSLTPDRICDKCAHDAKSGCKLYYHKYSHWQEDAKAEALCSEQDPEVACNTYWMLEATDSKQAGQDNLLVGVILSIASLILYFGGKWLINYLFPVQ